MKDSVLNKFKNITHKINLKIYQHIDNSKEKMYKNLDGNLRSRLLVEIGDDLRVMSRARFGTTIAQQLSNDLKEF